MDGTVTTQDRNVTCKTCNHFGESCANTNPDSQVGDCNEYEPMKSYVSPNICVSCANENDTCIPNSNDDCDGYKAITNEAKPFICDICARKGICGMHPNLDGTCVYGPSYNDISSFSDMETLRKRIERANNDMVNHPNHYTQGGIECIKAIEASMPPDGFPDYCKGTVIKYVWRFRQKNGLEDLKKARVYLNWMIESVEKEQENNESL